MIIWLTNIDITALNSFSYAIFNGHQIYLSTDYADDNCELLAKVPIEYKVPAEIREKSLHREEMSMVSIILQNSFSLRPFLSFEHCFIFSIRSYLNRSSASSSYFVCCGRLSRLTTNSAALSIGTLSSILKWNCSVLKMSLFVISGSYKGYFYSKSSKSSDSCSSSLPSSLFIIFLLIYYLYFK